MTKILLVDDSPTVAITIEWTLRNEGYEVHVVQDALAALDQLQVFGPRLVLLDIGLPHTSGIQLCEMIRNHTDYAFLPIVMLSGHSKEADVEQALDAGANDYLVKPVNEKKLLASVEYHLAQVNIKRDTRE